MPYLVQDFTYFVCGTCKDVVAEHRAIPVLAGMAPATRDRFAAMAERAPAGSVLLVIRDADTDAGRRVTAAYMPLDDALKGPR